MTVKTAWQIQRHKDISIIIIALTFHITHYTGLHTSEINISMPLNMMVNAKSRTLYFSVLNKC